MSIFIAGGCGFIGLNLAEAWLTKGEHVILFDRNPIPSVAARAFSKLPGKYDAVKGDIRSKKSLNNTINMSEISLFYYGAAVTSNAQRELTNPRKILEINLIGLINALEVAHESRIKRVINISSGSAYGPIRLSVESKEPMREELTSSDPDTLYGITKFTSERIVRRYAELANLDAVSVRLAAIYGPWEIDSGSRDTLSPLMQVALIAKTGGKAILPRLDHQDWTYSRDVAKALIALGEARALHHDLYHITCRRQWAVADWCAALKKSFAKFEYEIATDSSNVDFHVATDRRPMSGDRLAKDIKHILPDDLDLAHTDYCTWIREYGDFWNK